MLVLWRQDMGFLSASYTGMTAAVVTGASSGIGYACAQTLANVGYTVFAGVRSEADAHRVSQLHASVRPLLLDVTAPEQIAAAVHAIRASGIPLQGVVNNSGIAVAGPLEYLPLEDFRRQFDVNVFGALAVTQAFLPLLRETQDARVVFMSSVSGQIAPPFVGPYASSKFALEAMADALRMELAAFGIHVAVVQPGNVRTPIWQKGRDAKDDLVERMPQQASVHYGHAVDSLVRATEHEERTGIEPGVVAQAVLHAITAARPKARYPVGNPPAWQRRLASLLPERVRDRLILRSITRH
ncbi:MAG TPA: SDR family oxidoreductase [Candidatus Baltobacteraceae bacterium]|jgi:NAD(P)-dependent dehydrogenase (short-subunit alcohol dehydrogenase family)|nr:SDR family oxidoreductase [Candidatus Baltobacteraceae bacterium]